MKALIKAAQKGDNQQPPVGDWPGRQTEVIRLYTLCRYPWADNGEMLGAPPHTVSEDPPRCLDRTMELCRH